jgi:hypothetical protein
LIEVGERRGLLLHGRGSGKLLLQMLQVQICAGIEHEEEGMVDSDEVQETESDEPVMGAAAGNLRGSRHGRRVFADAVTNVRTEGEGVTLTRRGWGIFGTNGLWRSFLPPQSAANQLKLD